MRQPLLFLPILILLHGHGIIKAELSIGGVRMKIEVLQAFVASVEQGSFSKAGEALYLSQPTVSRYIGELERQMNGALFMRNAHTCELTMLGKQFYIHARRIVNEWESIRELAKREADDRELTIRIGYAFEEALKLIAPALMKSGISSDKVELSVRFGEGSDITRLVREGKLDCAVMHLPSISSSTGLEIRQICKCRMCMYSSENHRLARQKSLKLEQLSNETDVRIAREAGYFKKIDEAFDKLNLPPIKHVYVQNALDCVPSIMYKNCIAISPDIYSPWPGCCKIPIEDWTTDFSLVFVTREDVFSVTTERLYKALCMVLKKE